MNRLFTLALLTLVLASSNTFGQKEGKPIYFDSEWYKCSKKNASYYRIIEKEGNLYSVKDFYLNRTLQMEGHWTDKKDELRTGEFKYYDSLSQISLLEHYSEDELHGELMRYYGNGAIKSKENYVEGERNGVYEEYYENGSLRAKANFVNGTVRGNAIRYNLSGGDVLVMDIDNRGNGSMRAYYVNGVLREEGKIEKGYRKAEWKFYKEDGTLEKTIEMNELEEVLKRQKANLQTGERESLPYIFLDGYDFGIEEELGKVYTPDLDASFPGGTSAMQQYISANVNYPLKAIKRNISSRVYVSFVVEPDGSISNVSFEAGNRIFEKEAIRLVKNMPHWVPGELKGKKVRARCRFPINFTLN